MSHNGDDPRQESEQKLCRYCERINLPAVLRQSIDASKKSRQPVSLGTGMWSLHRDGIPGCSGLCESCSLCSLIRRTLPLDDLRSEFGADLDETEWLVYGSATEMGFLESTSEPRKCTVFRHYHLGLTKIGSGGTYWTTERNGTIQGHGIQLAHNGSHADIFGALAYGRIVDSDADYDLYRNWLRLCDEQHGNRCKPASYKPDFSLRFIDVEQQCIVSAPPHARYIALSYVWGQRRQLKLTTVTSPTLMQPGAMARSHELPRTIKDSMIVTRSLGERYLWIDALCIIQDDEKDRATQIASMGLVYSGAILTIVAAGGDDSFDGLPGVGQSSRAVKQPEVTIQGKKLISTLRPYLGSVPSSRWNKRGWTFQEKILSKKLLIFTKHQIFFQCGQATYCEDIHLEPANLDLTVSLNHDNPESSARHSKRENAQSAFDRYRMYVENYTLNRSFSIQTDIINAFKGLTSVLEPDLGAFYHGLPMLRFGESLLWKGTQDPSTRRPSFPSWSWAGWQGPANMSGALVREYGRGMEGLKQIVPQTDDGIMWFKTSGTRLIPLTPVPEGVDADVDLEKAFLEKVGCKDSVWRSIPDLAPCIPRDHLICFGTSLAQLRVQLDKSTRKDSSRWDCNLVNVSGDFIANITLDAGWLAQQGWTAGCKQTFDVINIGRNVQGSSKVPREGYHIMMIEWDNSVASRVQLTDDIVPYKVWQATKPKARLIALK